MDNMEQLSLFRDYWKITNKTGHILKAHVTATVDGEIVYDDTNEITINSHIGYEQYEVNISWNLNEYSREKLGLYLGYNTNYQEFLFENNKHILRIIGEKYEVQIHSII